MPTEHRKTGFYIAWFFRCYEAKDTGWWPARTPDGRAITKQDAYFWRSLEVIAQEMNLIRSEDLKRMQQG